MKHLAFKYGIRMFAGFTLFFLLMHLLGQSQNSNLRIFNGIIHMGFMYLAIKEYKSSFPNAADNYLNGVAMGFYASIIGILPFAIFLMIFLDQTPHLMAEFKQEMPIGDYLNPVTASVFVLVEGLIVSLIGGYVLTRIVLMNQAKA
ncbi:MAG: hypothetical protein DHS20C18_35910 [Saprospiraceae bacterium]|nr:MAG: hypothetical protein DHS20C18_35910 [Saprospiraceae bacterium]